MVTTSIGQQCADHVTGIHVNMPVVRFGRPCDMTELTERRAVRSPESASTRTGAWATPTQQSHPAADPRLRAHRLPGRPVPRGSSRSSGRGPTTTGHPGAGADQGQMLDNISLYWFTATAASSARLYWESFNVVDGGTGRRARRGSRCSRRRSSAPSRRWAEQRYTDLRWYWNELDAAVTSPPSSSPRSSSTRSAASSAPCAEVLRPGQRTRRVPSTSCRALREISWL